MGSTNLPSKKVFFIKYYNLSWVVKILRKYLFHEGENENFIHF